MPYIIGFLIAVFLFVITYFGKHLTLSGAVLVAMIVATFSFFSLWRMLILLLITYAVLMLIDKATRKIRDPVNNNILDKSGARSAKQILANGTIALISTVLFVITENRVFLILFAVGVGETFADSIASDIGVLSKKIPRDICTWKQITPGISGGISSLGIAASISASIVFGVFSYICIRTSVSESLIIMVFSFLGSIIDSLIGSRLQAKYQCNVCKGFTEKKFHCEAQTNHIRGIKLMDNCAVNFHSNLISCGLCLIWIWGGI